MKKIADANLQMHLLELEITTRCNLNCKHCYNRNGKIIDMPLPIINDMLKFAYSNHVSTVVISGGESSMHPEFEEICKCIGKYKGLIGKTVLQSNGKIRDININLLRNYNSIHLSYDLNDANVRKDGEENLILAKELNKAGIYTYLFFTVHKKNIHYIDEVIERANHAQIDLGFNLYCDTGFNHELTLSMEDKLQVCEKLNTLSKKAKILPFKNPMTSILENRSSDSFLGIRGGCSAGIASCVILPNGDIIPCPFLRISIGNIYTDDLKDLWFKSNILKALRDRRAFKGSCKNCKYISYCGGCRKVAFEQTHDLQGEDPTCFKSIFRQKKNA